MKIRRIMAVLKKQIHDTLKNKTVLIQFIMFPVMALVMTNTISSSGISATYFVTLFATMYVGMAPMTSIASIISEEKEHNTLRVLLMSNVKPTEYLLGVGIYLYIRRLIHLKKEKVRLEQEEIRHKEIEKREQQIIALENEKLESELTVKSKELAVSTMTIIKKNEILVTIKEEVIVQKNALGSQYPNKYYDKLIRLLDENLSSEDDWAIFQTNFDRIHENFFRNLHTQFPDLTSNDLRFCAYLRLNLSSKDIAHLMNITLKGVEVGRYRVRKKIGIPSTKSLTEYMIEFK